MGVTLPRGELLCTLKEEGVLIHQWRDSYAVFVGLCYWNRGEERGAQLGEGKGLMVSPCQAFAFSSFRKFGPSRTMRRKLLSYKERLTVGRTRVFRVSTVVGIVGSGLFLLSPFSILVPFLWVSIVEGQKLTMDPDGYTIRRYGFCIN